jgi:FecR protein
MNALDGSGWSMTRQQVTFAAWLVFGLIAAVSSPADAIPSPSQVERTATISGANASSSRLAQAAPAQQDPAQAADPAALDPIGNVATLNGSATVTRNNAAAVPLKLKDDIFKNDVLQTSANSNLGVTFIDETTFNLTANARISIDNYVYEDGGPNNAALFNVARGTVAFVANAVAKTGDMKISTPTATLGIRGTTGLIEVPEGAAAAGSNNVSIKLYPDPDGRVGHIEINGRDGARLGLLSQGATGFTIRRDLGRGLGAGFAAVPLAISPREEARDRGIVRQVHAAQFVGRQVVTQRRNEIRNNPALRNNPARQPGTPGQNGLPRQNGLPGQPGQPALPGLPKQNSLPKPPGAAQPRQPGLPAQPGQPKQDNLPKRPGPAQPRQPGQPAQPAQPVQPGRPRPAGPPGLQRQGSPSLQRPAPQIRPAAPRRPAVPKRKPPKERH